MRIKVLKLNECYYVDNSFELSQYISEFFEYDIIDIETGELLHMGEPRHYSNKHITSGWNFWGY